MKYLFVSLALIVSIIGIIILTAMWFDYKLLKEVTPCNVYYEYDITHTFWVDAVNGTAYHVVDTIPVDTVWVKIK